MESKINIIDLFAGCGGLSDGFEQTHLYETIACVEWEKAPCLTLINRLKTKWNYENAEEIVLKFDIQKTKNLINGWTDDTLFGSHKGLDEIVQNSGKSIDAVIGGPPCQAYSVAGRIRDGNGMNDDYRNYLFESYLNVVNHFKPKLFVFENVPGLISAKPGGILIVDRITDAFEKAGYEIISNLSKNGIIDCTKFGVPQARKRVIILGVNKSAFKYNVQESLLDFYNKLLPNYYSESETVKSAISDLPKLVPLDKVAVVNGKKYSHTNNGVEVLNHSPRMHSQRDIEIFKLLTNDVLSGKNLYKTAESLKQLYFEVTGKNSNIHKYNVLKWNKPSNTIPAHLYKDGLRHIHPDPQQSRTITVREAARLQSFDDDFEFHGSITEQYKMVGNAVPPKFAKAIALAVNDFIKKYF